jgi:hypothetical protein
MKLVRYRDGDHATAGIVVDDQVLALRAIASAPTDVNALLAAGPKGRPSKYLAIGFNFSSYLDEIQRAAQQPQHAEAMQRFAHLRKAFPDQKLPTFFNKQVSCSSMADNGAMVVINDLGGERDGSAPGTTSNTIRPKHFAARKFELRQGPGTAARARCRRRRPLAGRTCECRKRSGANLRQTRLSLSWGSGR